MSEYSNRSLLFRNVGAVPGIPYLFRPEDRSGNPFIYIPRPRLAPPRFVSLGFARRVAVCSQSGPRKPCPKTV